MDFRVILKKGLSNSNFRVSFVFLVGVRIKFRVRVRVFSCDG